MAVPNLKTLQSPVPAILYSGQIADVGVATLYTVPANKAVRSATLLLHNNTGAPVTCYVSIVPSGQATDNTRRIGKVDLDGGDTFSIDDLKGQWLTEGAKIAVEVSAATSINAFLTGLVLS